MSPLWIVFTLLPLLGSAARFDCRGRILGAYYADAKSGCKAFHVCVRVAGGGIRDFRFFCPPGTLFHQEAQTCTDWGDDDPLACPAEIYDGQFDLYRIGSGYDTKKLSSPGNRDDEAEFGLQRAETGDRRNHVHNNQASDLRAAHSSDFFSGQRERGRDDSAPQTAAPSSPAPSPQPRQSFRRATTRATPTTVQYTTPASPPQPQPSSPAQYETSKRKFIRKRPVYVSTAASIPPTTFAPRQHYSEQPQQNFDRKNNFQNQNRPTPAPTTANVQVYQQNRQTPTPAAYVPNNYQNRQTPAPPANVPPQYKDEYVEVSRVTPKQPRFYSESTTYSAAPTTTASPYFLKKDNLVDVYNYDSQSTPGANTNTQNANRPFKVRNSFSVSDGPGEDFVRLTNRGSPTTVDYTTTRAVPTTTPANRNLNSVSYEPEKNNFVSFPGPKQNYYSPTTTVATTTFYTTSRSDPPLNLNTVAYNTNNGFNVPSSNYGGSEEDDGQYRLPPGEDDGQYRPELYERERELLSGAHSLNIAASGNRLPEDQKPKGKTQAPPKVVAQTAAPRPFRPAATPSAPTTTYSPEPTYTTTFRPQPANTQRTFDYFQTYTTTSRPNEQPVSVPQSFAPVNNAPARPASNSSPRNPEARPPSRAPLPPSSPAPSAPPAPRVTTRAPHFAKPANNNEDTSYDYAYYDSDPGFSEYDHIEEFGKTKTKV